ncbi:MAG: hypothetical protein ABIA04_01555 [Pseudomonadota bacterium]
MEEIIAKLDILRNVFQGTVFDHLVSNIVMETKKYIVETNNKPIETDIKKDCLKLIAKR